MSEPRLRNLYLPPFKAAIDAGADTVMCSFNSINGVPGLRQLGHRDRHPEEGVGLRRLHRERLHRGRGDAGLPAGEPGHRPVRARRRRGRAVGGGAVPERRHRLSRWSAPRSATSAQQLLASGDISMARLNDAVRRILRVKFRAGLFDHPYVDVAKAQDPASFLTAADRAAARKAAAQVDGAAEERRQHAAARPEQDDRGDRPARRRPARHARPVVGHRAGTRTRSACSPGIKAQNPDTTFTPGCTLHERRAAGRPATTTRAATPTSTGRAGRGQSADQVVLALGETREMSGEAASRTHDRPARPGAAADRRGQGDRQAVRGRAVQRPPADAGRRWRRRRRRSWRRGSPASRPATRSPTCCSARSTRAASCRCRSRGRSARCRSTTTTSRPAARATPRRSTTRATAT